MKQSENFDLGTVQCEEEKHCSFTNLKRSVKGSWEIRVPVTVTGEMWREKERERCFVVVKLEFLFLTGK